MISILRNTKYPYFLEAWLDYVINKQSVSVLLERMLFSIVHNMLVVVQYIVQ
jgi:hypothetical protein